MGSMNIGQTPNTSPVKPPSNSIKPETKPVEDNHGLIPKLCDQSHTQDPFKDQMGKLPNLGGPGIKPTPMFNDYGKDVDRIMDLGVAHVQARERGTQIKTPDVEFHLNHVMEDMTAGEKDELRDTIVERMSSKNTSQTERDVLQRMYNHVDSAADKAIPGKKPNFIDNIKEHLDKPFQQEIQPGKGHKGGSLMQKLDENLKPGSNGKEGIQESLDSIRQGINQAGGNSSSILSKLESHSHAQGHIKPQSGSGPINKLEPQSGSGPINKLP